jgi:cyanophycinase
VEIFMTFSASVAHPLTAVGLAVMLAACGGGDSVQSGQLVAPSVAGLDFETSTGLKGQTDGTGAFQFRPGDTVTFRVGGLSLGSAQAQAAVPLQSLLASAPSSLQDAGLVRLMQTLYTLDTDGDASNGVQISAAVRTALATPVRALADLADLQAAIVAPVQAALPGRSLTAANVGVNQFADAANRQHGIEQALRIGPVANQIVGGAGRNCSSFNGDRKSANCSADWTTILAEDPVFAGMSKAQVSFDSTYVVPDYRYSLTQSARQRLADLPASLFDDARKTIVLARIDARLSGTGKLTQLTFAELDGSKQLYVNGDDLWSTELSLADFDRMVAALCGVAAPANGADCSLADATLTALAGLPFDNTTHRDKALLVLRDLQKAFGTGSIKYRRNADGTTANPNLREQFRLRRLAQDGSAVSEGLTAGLNAAEKAIVRSVFGVTSAAESRKVEARTIRFLSNTASRDIYDQFVASARTLAGGATPRIGVVTSATENAFFDADINVWALRSAGADVVYLPFNGGLRRATDANQCALLTEHYHAFANTLSVAETVHMDIVYPDWHALQRTACADPAGLARTLDGLHGVYFSGGDQARHLEALQTKVAATAFKPSAELGALQVRFAQGKLVVSGTSAGNHIQGGGTWRNQSVPMIGGGDAYPALTAGFKPGSGAALDTPAAPTVYAQGGHGFFRYGVLDSHFSQRVREGRLIRATKEGKMDYGFGVDENTALVVSQPDASGSVSMSVLGAGGVFVVDVRQSVETAPPTAGYAIQGVKAHYLIQGDRLHISADGNLTVQLASHIGRPVLSPDATAPVVTQNRILDYGTANFLKMTRLMGLNGATQAVGTNADSTDTRARQTARFTFSLARTAETVFRGTDERVSFTNLSLSIRPE